MEHNLNLSSQLKLIEQNYEQIKAVLNIKLTLPGYHIIAEKYHPESFGSRYTVWSNGKDAVRLLWDGKDGWLYLAVLDSLPVDWRDDWKDLIYIPYDPRKNDLSYVKEMQLKIIGSLDR